MTPYWEDPKRQLRVFLGDCRDILPQFADGEFGSVVCDPPYGIGFADWDIPPDSAILQECLRVSEGSVVMFGGAPTRSMAHYYSLMPEPDRMMVWYRVCSNVMTPGTSMAYRWHPIFLWRYDRRQTHLKTDVLRSFEWPSKCAFQHRARKHLSAMLDLLRAFGGRSTLDPYMGSGTTLVAAAKLGIPATGVEISEEYCKMARCRLEGGFMDDEPMHLFNREAPE